MINMSLYATEVELTLRDGTVVPEGTPISTQSMIKAFRNCPREAYYKYKLRLQPKKLSQPLERGKWLHALIETHLKGGDWRAEHKRWSQRFARIFDEEKDQLGDLPTECEAIMLSYLWHYGDPAYRDQTDWTVHEVEMTVEAMMPNGHLFRGRIDALIENAFGLWCVDHKSHKRMPDWDFRMLDEQSPLYVWALRQMGIPVRGFIWNYLSTAGISVPELTVKGDRFKVHGASDYPTLVRAIKQAKADDEAGVFLADPAQKDKVKIELATLKAQRWAPGAAQTSPHFRRDVIEKSDELIERVLRTTMITSDKMHGYDFSDEDLIERNVGSCKGFMCGYRSLSMADLINGESDRLRRTDYRVGDPLEYYEEGSMK